MNRRGFFRRAMGGLVVGAASLYAPRLLDTALEELIPSTLATGNANYWICNWSSGAVVRNCVVWNNDETNEIMFSPDDLQRMKNGEVAFLQPRKLEPEPEIRG